MCDIKDDLAANNTFNHISSDLSENLVLYNAHQLKHKSYFCWSVMFHFSSSYNSGMRGKTSSLVCHKRKLPQFIITYW
ncbi:MAG: hypothetical protein WCG25_04120 [bacterium]